MLLCFVSYLNASNFVVTVIYLKLNYIYDVTAVYEDRQRVCPTSDVKTAGRQKKTKATEFWVPGSNLRSVTSVCKAGRVGDRRVYR